jgi:hypothetical protein
MPVPWKNGGDASTVDIQPGGPGNPWQVFDQNGMLDAPSGGARARSTMWGRDDRGGLSPRTLIYTGNPDDWTATLTYPLSSENALKRLNCPFNIRSRQYCSPNRANMTAYVSPGMIGYLQATITSFGYDNGLAMNDGQATDVNRTAALAASLEAKWTPLAHDDISLTTSDVAFKRVINISAETCQGACGLGTTEEDAWLAVTLKDASPAYGGGSAPWLYYTTDRWVTRTGVRIGALIGSDALDVVLAGSRVVVFSDTKAPVYAQLADIYNGITDPLLWASASGISESGTNFPKYAVAVDAATILAVGAGGRIWLSTDGGVSFSKIYDTGALTSNNLNAIDAQPGGNAFVGGNSGTLIRLSKVPGAASFVGAVVSVKDASLNVLSSNINSIRTPSTRGDEVYLGTAGGEIWRSRNINAVKPVFQNMKFDKAGIGSIADMDFIGYQGNTLFVVQSYTDGSSRVLRDFSGGALANDVEIIGDYVTPGNFGMVSIAAANENMAICVGPTHGTYAFIGMVRPAQ